MQSNSVPGWNTLLKADPPIPRIPGFKMSFQFDHKLPLRPIEVYQTVIQMIYDFAQRSWTEPVYAAESKQFLNYDVLILFLNSQPPPAPTQLQVMHCVAALYCAITVMTDDVLFCQLRCHLSIHADEVGALSIQPWDDGVTAHTNTSSTNKTSEVAELSNSASVSILDANIGQVTDPDNPSFVINYHFLGKSINSKDVSMAVLEAMTAAAPFPKHDTCQELLVVSPDGGCAIIIESVSSHHQFTYLWATRALKLMYQQIVVPQKRFGDLYLELRYNGQGYDQTFGELRMLKAVDGLFQNRTNIVADGK